MTDIIADKNRAGLMGPEQAKKLAKALTTDTAVTRTGLETFILGNSTTAQDWFQLVPSNYSAGNPYFSIKKTATAAQWNIALYDLVNNAGTINFDVATLSLNGSSLMTRNATEVITGTKTISIGTATTQTDYLVLRPTDYAVGKPLLTFAHSSVADNWTIGLWDGASTAGTINFNAGSMTHGGVAIARVDGPIFTLPPRLPSYTVATVPSAATYVRGMIYVSDGASNKRMAISDGTNWRFPDGAIVS